MPYFKSEDVTCALCGRNVSMLTYHHLIPKQKGGKYTDTVPLCQPCHTTIHLTFSNRELASEYNSIEKLKSAAPLQKYLQWIQGKPIEKIANKRKKR
ncbi:HNH endonuclease [Rhodocytophaga rosea]|uniref:HNH endonuclease n=1 Tax=Rhodocytophaga rosea TaxID=2704465 RepID=A0A6C0GML9_9BACT|nr:HNH endonuclease signature motif containing protein [Rhodocytophaga rosea]QHT68880.1 HNH endonuclease [Rhodocytophaga rosea]